MIVATLYCFVEESISANPIMHWCENNTDSFTWLIDRKEFRFGVKRAQSFLQMLPHLVYLVSIFYYTSYIKY